MKKIAVFFPGIGYNVDKPLMYYSRQQATALGYEIRLLRYSGFPDKVKGDRKKMLESFEIALSQAQSMLSDLDFKAYDEILFIGKSVGTVTAAAVASQCEVRDRIRLILYTPLEDTFSFPLRNTIVFTGQADPWVGKENSRISELCQKQSLICYTYAGANHSLETGETQADLANMKQIMQKTKEFMEENGADSLMDAIINFIERNTEAEIMKVE